MQIIFVSNEETTENILMRNSSCWSRVATPLYVDDLIEEEAIKFLRHAHMDRDIDKFSDLISDETAANIYKLVGGRIYQLMQFKRDASHGIPFEETRDKLLLKDREKFLDSARWHPFGPLLYSYGTNRDIRVCCTKCCKRCRRISWMSVLIGASLSCGGFLMGPLCSLSPNSLK